MTFFLMLLILVTGRLNLQQSRKIKSKFPCVYITLIFSDFFPLTFYPMTFYQRHYFLGLYQQPYCDLQKKVARRKNVGFIFIDFQSEDFALFRTFSLRYYFLDFISKDNRLSIKFKMRLYLGSGSLGCEEVNKNVSIHVLGLGRAWERGRGD